MAGRVAMGVLVVKVTEGCRGWLVRLISLTGSCGGRSRDNWLKILGTVMVLLNTLDIGRGDEGSRGKNFTSALFLPSSGLLEGLQGWVSTSGFAMAVGIWWWMSKKDNIAPYGRHHTTAAAVISLPLTHVMLPTQLGWCLMESPPLLLTPFLFSVGQYTSRTAPRMLVALFLAHYAHRCLLYPLRMRPSRTRNLPILVFLAALVFNVYNTYIQVRSLSHYTEYSSTWLLSPQFILGAMLFFSGMLINISADSTLISLRKLGPSNSTSNSSRAYRVPHGGFFELVSCPNYFGELVEWLGWAIAASSLAGLVFFVLAVANLVPRAVAHHHWYVQNFKEYPRSRKILVPFIF
ncbi:hypothetical protein GOP47_0024873 [Adiantum capillus-veneris]|uniref:3-oxo-5alpha-steroid 4-dehydrogenase (NADP(+)) n=1 Tax=Adiantum capillus-veneris TaxID=13818 RepID=A0A9D4U3T2_ADICA|nr:hypothetical protein GOP47_0024873 [Adiantum capillus-veneris]